MTEMFGEAWPPMSVPDLAPDDDDDLMVLSWPFFVCVNKGRHSSGCTMHEKGAFFLKF